MASSMASPLCAPLLLSLPLKPCTGARICLNSHTHTRTPTNKESGDVVNKEADAQAPPLLVALRDCSSSLSGTWLLLLALKEMSE